MSNTKTTPSPNAWLQVATPEPGYADCVVADIGRIVRSKAGRALLEQIRDSGRNVRIEKPYDLDPPNAWVQPRDPAAAVAGGSDCTVFYDPRQWPNAAHAAVKTSDVLLYNLLVQAASQLAGTAARRETADGGALMHLEKLEDYRP